VKYLVKQPTQSPTPQTIKPTMSEKATTCAVDSLLPNNEQQHISPLVQDRIQAMLRQNEQTKLHNEGNNSSNDTGSHSSKPQILKRSSSYSSPSKQNGNNGFVSKPGIHTAPLKTHSPQITKNLISIVAQHPNYITVKDNFPPSSISKTSTKSESCTTAAPISKKVNSDMGRNKRKQTFHASELKEDFNLKTMKSNSKVNNINKRKQSFQLVSEKEDVDLPPVQCAEDLLGSSDVEAADENVTDAGNDDTEFAKAKSKYREESSTSSESSSDSASDFERDWRSRYKKKGNRRKRKKKLLCKRLSSAKSQSKNERNNSKLGRDNSRIWRRKINFANGNWFECSLCLYKCTTEKDYLLHVKGHESADLEKKELAACNICNRKFMSKWHLQIHKAQHRNNEYQCSYCGMDFPTSSAIVGHIAEVHNFRADGT
jgi:hypothetical protein